MENLWIMPKTNWKRTVFISFYTIFIVQAMSKEFRRENKMEIGARQPANHPVKVVTEFE